MPRPQRHTDEPDTVKRPQIWVAGRQQPKFAMWAWIKVGTSMTRRWLAPRLDRGSASVKALAFQIEGGRFRLRLGKAQRFVPSRAAVIDILAGLAARMVDARLLLQPLPAEPLPLAYPNLVRPQIPPDQNHVPPVDHPAPLVALRRRTLSDTDPAVQAIRAMIHAEAEAVPVPATPLIKPHPASGRFSPIGPQEPMPPTLAMRLAAHLIAWTGLALSLPVGLAKATLYHLNGGDLKDWD